MNMLSPTAVGLDSAGPSPLVFETRALGNLFEIFCPTGSRFMCDPPVLDTDVDFLCYSEDDRSSYLREMGYKPDELSAAEEQSGRYTGPDAVQSPFKSWRKDNVNLIVTRDPDFARKHALATRLATRFNLLDKQDRVALFEAILYGKVS